MGRGREGAGERKRRHGGDGEGKRKETMDPGSSRKRETPQLFERATAYALSYLYVTALAMRMYLYGYV
jgi:hypothetical protein